MKKFLSIVLMALATFIIVAPTFAQDQEELIDLYPYDDPNALYGPSTPYTLVGDSNWDFIYAGHRYHVVRGGVRYAAHFTDENADGYISALEMPSLSWNAFASMIINDGDEEVILTTTNNRVDLTTVVHYIYSYFDEDGKLRMFEDAVLQYYMTNDGADGEWDWRFATESEIELWDEIEADQNRNHADELPNTRHANMRIMLDPSNPKGYVMEPLGYTTWRNADNRNSADFDDWSLFVEGDPTLVTIPAGWTVISFGTLDRGASNQKTTNFIQSLPRTMLDDDIDGLTFAYDHQPAVFDGLTALDDDPNTPGVNIIVEFNDTFDLSNTVSASWIDMFDNDGAIINRTERLSYSVDIKQDDIVLQTIDFTYDPDTESYTASSPVTAIDSSIFGEAYVATYRTVTPLDKTTEIDVDIVVGVIPPRFAGINAYRYVSERTIVDLLAGITADNGYGVDITDSIELTVPAGLNPYYPTPGVYQIGLRLEYNVHFEGQDALITINGNQYAYHPVINSGAPTANTHPIHLYTVVPTTMEMAWTSEFIVVAADGTVREKLSRANNKLTNEANPLPTNNDGNTNVVDQVNWLRNLVLNTGEYLVVVQGSSAVPANGVAKGLAFGDPVVIQEYVADENHLIVVEASYQLRVDDLTAPTVIIISDDYRIEADRFESAEEAVLANIVAFDNYDSSSQLDLRVNLNGMTLTPGTYTVTVTVFDRAINQTQVSYEVTVLAPSATQDDLDDLEDDLRDDFPSEQDIQDMIDDALGASGGASLTTVIIVAVVTALVSFGGAAALIFFKKS